MVLGCSSVGEGVFVNDTSVRLGTVVKVSCAFGYRLDGPNIIVCEETGTWSEVTTCVLIGTNSTYASSYPITLL